MESELHGKASGSLGARLARKLLVDLSIMTIIGIVLAVIGPFGTAGSPMGLRLISWIGFAWLGYFIYNPMGLLVGWLHERLQLPEIGLWIGVTLLATVPMAIAVWSIGFMPNAPRMPSPEEALSAYVNVLAIGASVTIIFILIERSRRASAEPEERVSVEQSATAEPSLAPMTQADEKPVRFLDRLPPHLGEELLALEMEDHYVRVHTALGSDLVLMRMRDAVAELDALEGAQVHRSWWVARDAVTGSTKDGRNVRLVLKGGLEAPVSRTNAPMLKQSGWY